MPKTYRKITHFFIVFLGLVGLVWPWQVSAETFPGQNGKIAVDDEVTITTFNPDGSGAVTFSGSDPAWSPDGSKLVFAASDADNREIFISNPDGTNRVQLTFTLTGVGNSLPSFSPDGSKIVFETNRDGDSEIYSMNADGSSPIRLTTNPSAETSPTFSPDGTKIAFVSDRDGDSEIYSMNPDGTGQTNLTNDPGSDSSPTFAPGGNKIAFITDRNGGQETFSMNPDGTAQALLTTEIFIGPSYSPDGTQIFGCGPGGPTIVNLDGSGSTFLPGLLCGPFMDKSSWAAIPVVISPVPPSAPTTPSAGTTTTTGTLADTGQNSWLYTVLASSLILIGLSVATRFKFGHK